MLVFSSDSGAKWCILEKFGRFVENWAGRRRDRRLDYLKLIINILNHPTVMIYRISALDGAILEKFGRFVENLAAADVESLMNASQMIDHSLHKHISRHL
jgi:hypothetical protein